MTKSQELTICAEMIDEALSNAHCKNIEWIEFGSEDEDFSNHEDPPNRTIRFWCGGNPYTIEIRRDD